MVESRDSSPQSSAGHKLGQLIGDWFEEYYVFPLLRTVAYELGLFLDTRFISRPNRGDKLLWKDLDGNVVDYDFVLELNGSDEMRGVPVAFIECFWRRGSRHSKDKARDDCGKLQPMAITYPTARFLGILAAGEFTAPAHELVISKGIDLFYVPKSKVIEAFQQHGLAIDYPDRAKEAVKQQISSLFEVKFANADKEAIAESVMALQGRATVTSYVDRIRAKLGALPQEIRFILRHASTAVAFGTIDDASNFLDHPTFDMASPVESYVYQITYSDGSEFEHNVSSLQDLRTLHRDIETLVEHMNNLR